MIPIFRVFMADDAELEVLRVLNSGQLAEGPEVAKFESALSERFGAQVLALNSCTSAIDLSLHLIGVGPDDEVITTAQTCVATNIGIVRRGALPVFVDVDSESGLIDPVDVANNITGKTKAIVAVDWAGHPCDYDLLRSHGLPVIEDAAHAFDTRYQERHVAQSGGDYVCFSFQAIKHLTTGDGGALKTPDDQIDRARRLRWFGLNRAGDNRFEQDIEEAGYKYHMNDIAAAIGNANLQRIDWVLDRHRRNAKRLHAALRDVWISLPAMDDGSSWWLFTILVDDPTSFIEKMGRCGIACSRVHARNDKLSAFANRRRSVDLGGLRHFANHQVSIPVGWWLGAAEIDQVAEAVRRCS